MPRQNKDNHSTSPILAAIERLSQKIEEQRCNHHDHSDRLARIEFEVFEMKTMLEEVNEKLNSVIGAPAVQPVSKRARSDKTRGTGHQASGRMGQRQGVPA